jgi:hypothetical protein
MADSGISHAVFDADGEVWVFEDSFPPLESARPTSESDDWLRSNETRVADARRLTELARSARAALEGRGSRMVSQQFEALDETLRGLGPATREIRDDALRQLFSDSLLALRRYLAAEPGSYRQNARDELRGLIDDFRFHDAWVDVRHAADLEARARRRFEVSVLTGSAEPPSQAQIAAYEVFRQDMEAMCGLIMEKILVGYQEWRSRGFLHLDEGTPEVTNVEDMRGLLEFQGMMVHSQGEDGACALELSFRCEWDPEHGVRVFVRGEEIGWE